MAPETRLAARAEMQHGVVDRRQALECGVTKSTLQRWVAHGRLVQVHAGVYRWPAAPTTWRQSLVAACLACGPGAVASHRSAAALWALGSGDDVVEISVRRPRGPAPAGVVIHRSRDLVPSHTTVRNGVPVTNPLRTLVDLGAVCSRWEVEDALDRGLVARRFTVAAAEWMLHDVARPGRRGCGVLRTVLDERALGTARPDGLLEPRMARLLRTYGFPPAVFRHPVPAARAELDFAYPELRLGIEVDGYEVHGTPRAMTSDHERHRRLVAAGWTIVRFTWHDVVRRPGRAAADLRAVWAAFVPEAG
jgi:very-short-patch-repair endonuclease